MTRRWAFRSMDYRPVFPFLMAQCHLVYSKRCRVDHLPVVCRRKCIDERRVPRWAKWKPYGTRSEAGRWEWRRQHTSWMEPSRCLHAVCRNKRNTAADTDLSRSTCRTAPLTEIRLVIIIYIFISSYMAASTGNNEYNQKLHTQRQTTDKK